MSLFDDIVFLKRNKEYGAYYLRKRYHKHLIIAFIAALIFFAVFMLYSMLHLSMKTNSVYQILNDSTGIIEFTNFDLDPIPIEPKNNPQVSGVDETSIEVAKVTTDEFGFEDEKTEEMIEKMLNAFKDELAVDLEKDIEQSVTQQDASHSNNTLLDLHSPIKARETELRRYILQNTKYPDSALNNKINGLVLVQFVLTAKGDIANITLLKKTNTVLDREAVRVVKTIPHNKPVAIKGKPVAIMYKIPIVFKYNQ